MQVEEEAAFDCRATAAFLRSGGSIAMAGHVAALMNMLVKSDLIAALVWCSVVYFAVRVKIDAEFFDVLATHPAAQLDSWLFAANLRKTTPFRSIPNRRRGAMRLWWGLLWAVVFQIALLVFRLVA